MTLALLLRLWPYLLGVGLLIAIAGGSYHRGALSERHKWESAQDKANLLASEHAEKVAVANTIEVTRYVDRVQTIEKRVPVVRDRIVHALCEPTPDDSTAIVPSAGDLAAPPQTDTSSRFADDLVSARENAEQCSALIAVVKPQTK